MLEQTTSTKEKGHTPEVIPDSSDSSSPTERTKKLVSGAGGFGAQLLWDFVETAIVALAICVVVYLFVAQPHLVIGSSMEANFHDGEYLLSNKFAYRFGEPARGDVIVFKHSETEDYIKRIIALPGETVSLKEGKVYIDGKLLDEASYIDANVKTQYGATLKEGESLTLVDDEYFVLGDNRSHSSDSRAFGTLKRSEIKGKAWIVYWPVSAFRIVSGPAYN